MFETNNKAIYLQIADRICDAILSHRYTADTRLPSVREYGSMVQVNPNTVMRTYEHLQRQGIIYNKRGIGFFTAQDAEQIIRRERAREIMEVGLTQIFTQLKLLGVTPSELQERYAAFLAQKNQSSDESEN